MKEIQLTKGAIALVDDNDYEDLIKYRWHLNGKYAHNLKLGPMHRYLMGFSPEKGRRGPKKDQIQIDHKDENTLNNTKSNLRLVNNSQNQLNHSKAKGKSKYRGVIWAGCQKSLLDNNRPWIARIKPTGSKRIYLGSFETEREAAISYNEAVLRYCPSYGKLNIIEDN